VTNPGDPEVERGDDRRSWGILSGFFSLRRVDPDRLGEVGRLGRSFDEALGMRRVGRREDALPMGADDGRVAEVDDRGRQESEAAVMMRVVVPVKEPVTERPTIVEGSEALRKLRAVLEGLELGFRERDCR
jgi:hypothetical protein